MLGNRQVRAPIAIEIGNGAASLLPINCDARLAGSQGAEAAPSVAKQDEADARIVAGSLGVHAEEVLREEHILVSVTVKVGDADAKGGSKLGLDGQRPRLEMIAAVQEHHRIKRGSLEFAGGPDLSPSNSCTLARP